MDLRSRRCVPCEGATHRLSEADASRLHSQLAGWKLHDDKLSKSLTFADFRAAMAFLSRLADLAEAEGHHPDFCVHYSRVDLCLWTHAVAGLSENDFILAAKIDAL